MLINTRHFGEIEVEEEKFLEFIDGIPGFDGITKFVIIENPDPEIPFHWLQSVEDGNVTFVITNPFLFMIDYDFEISESILAKLEIEDQKEILIYSMVVVPEEITEMTTNLMAPIIINRNNRKAKQVILDGTKYSLKHYIFQQPIKTSLDADNNQSKETKEAL